jgi:hypothetical protein
MEGVEDQMIYLKSGILRELALRDACRLFAYVHGDSLHPVVAIPVSWLEWVRMLHI